MQPFVLVLLFGKTRTMSIPAIMLQPAHLAVKGKLVSPAFMNELQRSSERGREREAGRQAGRQINKRERDTERDREKDRQRQTDRDRCATTVLETD